MTRRVWLILTPPPGRKRATMRRFLFLSPWSPSVASHRVTLVSQLTLMVIMMVRGLDYAAGETEWGARRLAVVQSAASLPVWGWAFTIAATIGLIGMALRSTHAVLTAHLAGWVTYWALSMGLLADVWARSADHPRHIQVPAAAILCAIALVVCVAAWWLGEWEHSPLITAAALVACIGGVATLELDGLRNAVILAGIGALHMNFAFGIAATIRRQKITSDRQDRDADGR